MPKVLKEFLQNLRETDPENSTLVWEWLDCNPNALDEMVELVMCRDSGGPPYDAATATEMYDD